MERDRYFMFSRELVKERAWADLSKAAKAVFPVVAVHSDARGYSFPGERVIAELSGRTEKVARRGIADLSDACFHGFAWTRRVTNRGRRSKRFFVQHSPEGRGAAFPFNRGIIDSGTWAKLSPTAQSLYPVMRTFSHYDHELCMFEDDPDLVAGLDVDKAIFVARRADLCDADEDVLIEYAGIARRSFPAAMANLEENGMIEPVNEGWLVSLRVLAKSTGHDECLAKSVPEVAKGII
jgi:hypothetical protein